MYFTKYLLLSILSLCFIQCPLKGKPYPLGFSISETKIVMDIPPKDKDFAFIIPGDLRTYIYSSERDYIVVNKKDVLHTFVPFDTSTDHFVRDVFATWENETFDVFDQVKDPTGIAIDLGAWIGTTAIWLSKNFSHIIAVDADLVSLKCLRMNLAASQCSNVTVCERPVAEKSEKVVFGTRGDALNESISYIKKDFDKSDDYNVQSITFKQLIHDYIYKNEQLKSQKIAFIKCDIEGGEEDVIEDILYFAYHNKSKVYLSFHLNWWKSRRIGDFEYLFKFFKTNCPRADICAYLQQNPFASILFEPLDDAGILIKRNIPVVIIGYNLYTYIKDMVTQLEKYTSDIIIVDNNSSYEPLINYYKNDFKYTLLQQNTNHGHTVCYHDFVQKLVGDIYLLTDPDLQFNSKLPDDFISVLIDISKCFGARKVGFALCIDADDIRTDVFYQGLTIKEWEDNFWRRPLEYPINPTMKLYDAAIDTTFCLVNKKSAHESMIRIAGDYTCFHLPWHNEFKSRLQPGEHEAYLRNNVSSSWVR